MFQRSVEPLPSVLRPAAGSGQELGDKVIGLAVLHNLLRLLRRRDKLWAPHKRLHLLLLLWVDLQVGPPEAEGRNEYSKTSLQRKSLQR